MSSIEHSAGLGSPAITVLIAERQALVRSVLGGLIDSTTPLRLVGAARDVDEAILLADAHRPHVALLDVKMPGGAGRAVRAIRQVSPETAVVALSAPDDRDLVREMIRSGAIGSLVRGTSGATVVETLTRTALGQSTLPPEVIAAVIEELAAHLQLQGQAAERLRGQEVEVRDVLRGAGLTMLFQPIVCLGTAELVGMEALARFAPRPVRGPEMWFAQAAAAGLRGELELTAVRAAVSRLADLPEGTFLSVNVSPATLISPGMGETLAEAPLRRIVLELTEHAQVADYGHMNGALHELRRAGVRLAIDDAGAGFSSLRHVLRLTPDFIKLDGTLTRNIDRDPPRRALAKALNRFASEMGAAIIAEGIESRAEAETLRSLGASYGQGYHIGRPSPLCA